MRTVRYFKGLEKVHNELLSVDGGHADGEHKEVKSTGAAAALAAHGISSGTTTAATPAATTATASPAVPVAAVPAATTTGGAPAVVAPSQSSSMANFMMGRGVGGL